MLIMSDIDTVELGDIPVGAENLARKYATEKLLQPSEAFDKYASSLIPLESADQQRVGIIQEAARRYNREADEKRQISLLFHFTDDDGVAGITQTKMLGKGDGSRLYLTYVSPELARPLSTAEDAKGYEKYFRDKIMPTNLQEHLDRFVLGLKFKWKHDVLKRIKSRSGTLIVPVGAHKIENVVIVAADRDNLSLKKDEEGEIYTEKPIKIGTGSGFSTFGPYRVVA